MTQEHPVVDTPVTPTEPVTSAPDYAALVVAKTTEVDAQKAELTTLRDQMSKLGEASEQDKAEKARLTLEQAKLITSLSGLQDELKTAQAERAKELETMSKATESVLGSNASLEAELKAAREQIAAFEAKEKQESLAKSRDVLIAKEFPQLLPFAAWIAPVDGDDAMRAVLKKFNDESLSPAMNNAKQVLSGGAAGAMGQNPTAPVARTEPLDASEAIRAELDEAMSKGNFEDVLKRQIEAYEVGRRT